MEQGIESVRDLYRECVALFRSLGRDDETARALTWWGQAEAAAGNFGDAASRLLEARSLSGGDLAVHLALEVAACYLATGDRANAEPAAREALALAANLRHPLCTPWAISYVAALAAECDPIEAARLLGYAQAQFRAAGWNHVAHDRAIVERLLQTLGRALSAERLAELADEGAALTEDEAISAAASAGL